MPLFAQGYALLIGISDYQDSNPAWQAPPLAAETEAIAKALRTDTIGAYPPDQVLVRTNAQARLADVHAALTQLAQQVPPTATVFIYLSGHGALGTDGDYYFATQDTVFTADNHIQAGTGLSKTRLLELLRGIKSQKLLIIINACFSGHFHATLGGAAGPTPTVTRLGTPSNDANFAADILKTGEGRAVITASRASQYSSYVGTQQTFFGAALIEALNGQGSTSASGYVGLYELYLHIHTQVTKAAKAIGELQDPVLTMLDVVGAFPVALRQGGGAAPDETLILKNLPAGTAVHIITQAVDLSGARIENVNITVSSPPRSPTQPRVFLSRCLKTDLQAQTMVAALTDRLQAAGFEVLPDPVRHPPDQEWQPDLYIDLAIAHAAILVVSNEALASDRVWCEAHLLTGRHLLGEVTCPTSQFKLLCLTLDTVPPAALRTGRWARLNLDALPALTGAQPIDAALAELDVFKQSKELWTRLEQLEKDIAVQLTKADANTLALVGHTLGLPIDARLSDDRARLWLARGLWQSDIEDWVIAAQQLASYVADRRLLVDLYAPAWLDPVVARGLLDAATTPSAGSRAILVNGTYDDFTPQTLVCRAFCLARPQARPIVPIGPAMSDQAFDKYVADIRAKLNKEFFPRVAPRPADFNAKLRDKLAHDGPAFVVVPPGPPDRDRLKELLDAFPIAGLTFVVLTAGDEVNTQPLLSLDNVMKLEPELNTTREFDAVNQYYAAVP